MNADYYTDRVVEALTQAEIAGHDPQEIVTAAMERIDRHQAAAAARAARDLARGATDLGKKQLAVLKCVGRGPYPGGGWIYNTHSGTIRVLESLARRGLVDVEVDPRRPPRRNTYRISDAGRQALESLQS